VSGRACFRRLPAAGVLQASGFRSDVELESEKAATEAKLAALEGESQA
jgi:hypothetical protein